jgi:ribonuclease BN (tRNA processing enzyme)
VRLVVLGCSGGYPGPGRACSGYLLETASARLWIDAGSGTFAELQRHCSPEDVSAIVVTHLHADHWTDLPLAVHTIGFMHPEVKRLPVFGPPGFVDACGITLRWRLEDDVFEPRELHDGLRAQVAGAAVEASRVEHGDLETYGLRIADNGLTFAYSADSAPCPALAQLARNADLFLCEATRAAGPMTAHSTPEEAGQLASEAGARRLVLTHLDPEEDPEQARELARTTFDGEVLVAREGLVVEIGTLS